MFQQIITGYHPTILHPTVEVARSSSLRRCFGDFSRTPYWSATNSGVTRCRVGHVRFLDAWDFRKRIPVEMDYRRMLYPVQLRLYMLWYIYIYIGLYYIKYLRSRLFCSLNRTKTNTLFGSPIRLRSRSLHRRGSRRRCWQRRASRWINPPGCGWSFCRCSVTLRGRLGLGNT